MPDGGAGGPALDTAALAALGGVSAVIKQYSAACTGELRRSWLCVLFDVAADEAVQVRRVRDCPAEGPPPAPAAARHSSASCFQTGV